MSLLHNPLQNRNAEAEHLFVGRSRELEGLETAVHHAATGKSQVVIVDGELGIGKTELARQFRARVPHLNWLWVPLELDADAQIQQGRVIRELAHRISKSHAERAKAALARTELSPDKKKRFLGALLIDILQSHSVGPGAVIVFDNLSSLDKLSLDIISYACARLSNERTVVVLIGRDYPTTWRDQLRYSDWSRRPVRMTLQGLPATEVEQITRHNYPSQTSPDRIRYLSGGNPLFIRELRHRCAAGSAGLTVRTGRGVLWNALQHDFATLSADEKDVLVALSVWGDSSADVLALAKMIGFETETLGIAVEELVRRGLLERSPTAGGVTRVRFRHSIIRDEIYARLQTNVRKRLHRSAIPLSEGIEEWRHRIEAFEDQNDLFLDQLECLAIANRKSNMRESAQYYLWCYRTEGLKTFRGQSALLEAVRLMLMTSRESEALTYLADVTNIVDSGAKLEVLGLLELALGKVNAARALLERASATTSPDQDTETYCRVQLELAYCSLILGADAQALETSRAVVENATPPGILSGGHAFHAWALSLRDGDPNSGLDYLATYLPEQAIDASAPRSAELAIRGLLRGLDGHLEGAITDLTVASSPSAVPHSLGIVGINPLLHLAGSFFVLGDWRNADRALRRAFHEADERERRIDIPALHSLAAMLAASRGEIAVARRELELAQHSSKEFDYLGAHTHTRLAQAAIGAAEGKPEVIVAALNPLVGGAVETARVRLYASYWIFTLIDAELDLGWTSTARAHLDLATTRPRRGSSQRVAEYRLRGKLAITDDDTETAHYWYKKGLEEGYTGGESIWIRAHLHHAYGLFVCAEGDTVRGKELLTKAANAFHAIGALPDYTRCTRDIDKLSPVEDDQLLTQLTDREREVASYIGQGWTNREIAEALFVSSKTVEYHLRNIFQKLHMANRRELRNAIHKADNGHHTGIGIT